MKRPTYLKIRIARGKSTLSPAVTKYFKQLKNKELEIRYGELKTKKVFKYKIREAGANEYSIYWPIKRTIKFLEIVLDLIPEKENENL